MICAIEPEKQILEPDEHQVLLDKWDVTLCMRVRRLSQMTEMANPPEWLWVREMSLILEALRKIRQLLLRES